MPSERTERIPMWSLPWQALQRTLAAELHARPTSRCKDDLSLAPVAAWLARREHRLVISAPQAQARTWRRVARRDVG